MAVDGHSSSIGQRQLVGDLELAAEFGHADGLGSRRVPGSGSSRHARDFQGVGLGAGRLGEGRLHGSHARGLRDWRWLPDLRELYLLFTCTTCTTN